MSELRRVDYDAILQGYGSDRTFYESTGVDERITKLQAVADAARTALKWYAGEGTGEPGEFKVVDVKSETVVYDFSTFGDRACHALAALDSEQAKPVVDIVPDMDAVDREFMEACTGEQAKPTHLPSCGSVLYPGDIECDCGNAQAEEAE